MGTGNESKRNGSLNWGSLNRTRFYRYLHIDGRLDATYSSDPRISDHWRSSPHKNHTMDEVRFQPAYQCLGRHDLYADEDFSHCRVSVLERRQVSPSDNIYKMSSDALTPNEISKLPWCDKFWCLSSNYGQDISSILTLHQHAWPSCSHSIPVHLHDLLGIIWITCLFYRLNFIIVKRVVFRTVQMWESAYMRWAVRRSESCKWDTSYLSWWISISGCRYGRHSCDCTCLGRNISSH